MAKEIKREKKKHSNAKEPYKSGKKNPTTVTKDRQLGERRPQQSP